MDHNYQQKLSTTTQQNITPTAPIMSNIPIATAVILDGDNCKNYMVQSTPTQFTSTQPLQNNDDKLFKFRDFIMKYEISNDFAIKLRQLEGFDVVIICDDSSSMNTVVTTPNTKNFMNLPTRWDEMKTIIKIIMEATMLLDDDGIDIYFLNRECQKNVTNLSVIDNLFNIKPNGYTPIVETFKKVLEDKHNVLSEKKLLIILATDGEPTDRSGRTEDFRGVSEIDNLFNTLNKLRNPRERIFTTIVACTDDDTVMNYLDNWDKKLFNFDLVDDYYSEKERIINAQGNNFRFSYGDYIVKILLGSVDKSIGAIDGSCFNNKISPNNKNIDTYNKHTNICQIL